MDQTAFTEEQRFRQPWIWILFAGDVVLVVGIVSIVSAWNIVGITTLVLVFGGLSALLFSANLTTQVRNDGLYVRYFPFHRSWRKISLDNVSSIEAREYSPLREYGGWGIRGAAKNRAYNVSGNRGVQLVYEDGRRLLIGSQKPDELLAAIQSLRR